MADRTSFIGAEIKPLAPLQGNSSAISALGLSPAVQAPEPAPVVNAPSPRGV
ncbi:MAG: hypothetical protein KBC88_08245 [Alphaproteobacteria bacterium]|jgi:hypothetical protein|nr:hypothetical protein [Alphaproteobacteria bacterium]